MNESSSEVAKPAARLLRREHPLRELGLSSGERASHRSWASGIRLSSCEGMLAGAGRFVARASTVSRPLSELPHTYEHQLRQAGS